MTTVNRRSRPSSQVTVQQKEGRGREASTSPLRETTERAKAVEFALQCPGDPETRPAVHARTHDCQRRESPAVHSVRRDQSGHHEEPLAVIAGPRRTVMRPDHSAASIGLRSRIWLAPKPLGVRKSASWRRTGVF